MIIENTLESIKEWVEENICAKLNLMKHDNENEGRGYDAEPIHPYAFTMFIPAKELLPPEIESHLPAVCVQLMRGSDNLKSNERSFNIRLAYAVYAPGEFPTEGTKIKRSDKGWKQAMHCIDVSLRVLESQRYIAGMAIDPNVPIEYGFFDQSETLVNSYPEWYTFITLKLNAGTADRLTSYNEFL